MDRWTIGRSSSFTLVRGSAGTMAKLWTALRLDGEIESDDRKALGPMVAAVEHLESLTLENVLRTLEVHRLFFQDQNAGSSSWHDYQIVGSRSWPGCRQVLFQNQNGRSTSWLQDQ
jgi:hypothetical protein